MNLLSKTVTEAFSLSALNPQMVVLQPQGQLNFHSGKVLKEQMADLLSQSFQVWVFDLERVDFLDSSGLAALLPGLLAARQIGCRLMLCNVQASVRLVFELTQIDSVLEIFESYDAVLTRINAGKGDK